jgi:hypothetical protein
MAANVSTPASQADSDAAVGATAAVGGPSLAWWGTYHIAEGHGGIWEIGPLVLTVERRAREWRVSWQQDAKGDGIASRCAVTCPVPAASLPPTNQAARFAASATTRALRLEPALPDRQIVARPELPLSLLGGEDVSLFVSIPLSVRVFASGDRRVVDVPSLRLQDTWFGPSTRVGELCYATKTRARLHAAELAVCPHLAICRVRLANHAESPLVVDRLSLPVHLLDLWAHRDRGLWTRAIEVERAADGSLASVRLGDGPPEQAAGAVRLTTAREPDTWLRVVRAIESFLQ